jgi:tRNA (guanine-N7-)-methyltransferase
LPVETRPRFGNSGAIVLHFGLLSPGVHLPRDYWVSLLPGISRVKIEIGSGDGRFLYEAALAAPSTLFVGFEVRASSTARTERRGLPRNAWIKHIDGRWCVEHLFADATIDAYHTYFPDPWWKKRHAKRRIFTPTFAAALHRTLKPDGGLYVITDVETRFREIDATLAAAGFVATPWQRDPTSPAQSSYERKYRAQGRRLFSARFAKK